MRRHRRKPAGMRTRAYVNHLLCINNKELPYLPPFGRDLGLVDWRGHWYHLVRSPKVLGEQDGWARLWSSCTNYWQLDQFLRASWSRGTSRCFRYHSQGSFKVQVFAQEVQVFWSWNQGKVVSLPQNGYSQHEWVWDPQEDQGSKETEVLFRVLPRTRLGSASLMMPSPSLRRNSTLLARRLPEKLSRRRRPSATPSLTSGRATTTTTTMRPLRPLLPTRPSTLRTWSSSWRRLISALPTSSFPKTARSLSERTGQNEKKAFITMFQKFRTLYSSRWL